MHCFCITECPFRKRSGSAGNSRLLWEGTLAMSFLAMVLTMTSAGCDVKEEDKAERKEQQHGESLPRVGARFTNSIGMELVGIKAGLFLMGSEHPDESLSPELRKLEIAHEVEIAQDFYISTTEVTNKQFRRFLSETNYRGGKQGNKDFLLHLKDRQFASYLGADRPVVFVSWYDATAFCRWLSKREGKLYRLLTEEEWEYACRAGTGDKYAGTSGEGEVLDYAWLRGNSKNRPHNVGTKLPNRWGLYDMTGNVWEWTGSMAPKKMVDDSVVYAGKKVAFIRGGCFFNVLTSAICTGRWAGWPLGKRDGHLGFRVAMTPSGQ